MEKQKTAIQKLIDYMEENFHLTEDSRIVLKNALEDENELVYRSDAEEWLSKNKDIWNHPRITDRNNKESYELADLMAEYANWINLK